MELDFPHTVSEERRQLLTATAERLRADHGSDLLGLALTGSTAHGLETDQSDIDLLVVLEPRVAQDPEAPWLHTTQLEQIPITLQRLENPAAFDEPGWPFRWSYAWAPVLIDFTGGRIPAAIDRQGRLTPEETMDIVLRRRIGDYVNLTYRALKSARDGRRLAAALDASEAVPMFLDVVFGLDGLVRPYNKALVWSLHNHPLSGWSADGLLTTIDRALGGEPEALRYGLTRVREAALHFDRIHQQTAFKDFFDEWSDDSHGAVLGLKLRDRY